MIALADINSFYCSAEQVFRPDWRKRPLIVLSNNDGVVVSANREAKAIGIEKFKPFHEVKSLCDQHGVIHLSSNYELYADISQRIFSTLSQYTPDHYVYSIDEIFLDFTKFRKLVDDFNQLGSVIRRRAWKEHRLPICVGFGDTLTLAKVANQIAKKNESFNGVCVIDTPRRRKELLSILPVSDVWGVGRKLSAHFRLMGISSALDLANKPPALMRKRFNVTVEQIIRELNGEKCKHWDSARADKQQIFSTRSTGNRITDLESLRQALVMHTNIASRKARAQKSLCGVMLAFAANSGYDEKPISFKAIHRFEYPTSDVTHLSTVASQLASKLFVEGIRFYKIGIGLLDLSSSQTQQLDLFNSRPSNPKLMSIYDDLNNKYGNDTVFVASQGVQPKWEMRRQFLTPQYTTKWSDIPRIKC